MAERTGVGDGAERPGKLDALLADPTRLSIVALLAASQEAEFRYVRDSVNLSDSALSKQASMLSKYGYIDIRKGHVGNRPRTWYTLTSEGRAHLADHVAALRAIAAHADQTP